MSLNKFVPVHAEFEPEASKEIDWNKCLFCQDSNKKEKISVPLNNKRDDVNEVFQSLANRLLKFHSIGNVPFQLNVAKLNEGQGLCANLLTKNAKWHHNCYTKCNQFHLNKAVERHAKRKVEETSEEKTHGDHCSPAKTRRTFPPHVKTKCVFCEKGDEEESLHRVNSFDVSNYIKEGAKLLKDWSLFGRCEGAFDMMSSDTLYHAPCYKQFRRSVTTAKSSANCTVGQSSTCVANTALQSVISYVNLVRETAPANEAPVFPVTELLKRYAVTFEEAGLKCDEHTTRLKQRLLDRCSYLEDLGSKGQPLLLTFKKDVNKAVKSLCTNSSDNDQRALQNAATIVRNAIFCHPNWSYDKIKTESQSNCVPPMLLNLVKMIIHGPNQSHTGEDEDCIDQEASTIAQLLFFHATKRGRAQTGRRIHKKERETPVAVYLAMKIYGDTRNKGLIEVTHKLGLSISYERLRTIVNAYAASLAEFYKKEELVCPPGLCTGLFCTTEADNLDHNPTAMTSKTATHATAISMVQHPDAENKGLPRSAPAIVQAEGVKVSSITLPSDYAIVPPCFLNPDHAQCPLSDVSPLNFDEAETPFDREFEWLGSISTSEGSSFVGWAAFHAESERLRPRFTCKSAVFPIFAEQAHTMSMMMHTMNISIKATRHLNPKQIAVLVVDQPLYANCKKLQFLRPDLYGETIFILMGSLHIEMAALKVLGEWLEGSGWTSALVSASVTTQGRADSVLKGGHVTRSRYAHEVTVAVLFSLLRDAYEAHDADDLLSFDEWCTDRRKRFPQFTYWEQTFRLELLVLQLVKSVRSGNFELYIETLTRLVYWFFALDHVHYARWLAVHLQDLLSLKETNAQLFREFQAGKFVALKSDRPFSRMGLDQMHEQINAKLKGDGGMIGLTENPDALLKWMLAGPLVADFIETFEGSCSLKGALPSNSHHSETQCFQSSFRKDVRMLRQHFLDVGNPFLEESGDLYNVETGQIASKSVVETVQNIEAWGEKQYVNFVNERFKTRAVPFSAKISKNKYPLLSSVNKKTKPGSKAKFSDLRNDCALFSKLYIACQMRDGDLDEFFKHENQGFPPALTSNGEMRTCKKSDLVSCLTDCTPNSILPCRPPVDAVMLDGAAMVHIIKPAATTRTFGDYIQDVFIPFLRNESKFVVRIDLVLDRYFPDSLKSGARDKRGSSSDIRVAAQTKIPKGWPNFLRQDNNKKQLFELLARSVVEMNLHTCDVYATLEEDVLVSSETNDIHNLKPCTQEEADTRLMLHASDAARKGHARVMIRSVDTDVLVLAVWLVSQLEELKELWVSFGTGISHKYVAAHEIAATLGPQRSLALPAFHALTGCDTVSSFSGHGKKSAFETWKAMPDATNGFISLGQGLILESWPIIEQFVVAMYERSSGTVSVNACRRNLFTKKGRLLASIPPTEDALRLHAQRSAYQALVWCSSLQPAPQLPVPSQYGWKLFDGHFQPVWITLPVASKSLRELISCKCKTPCDSKRCSCNKNKLPCTDLCSCSCVE